MFRSAAWAHARRRGCSRHHSHEHEHAGPGNFAGPAAGPWEAPPFFGFGMRGFGDDSFGVRRPLRFLAHKLELSEEQVGQLARILDDLKTERAQASVDDRRTLADFADAMDAEAFDAARVDTGAQRRAESAAKVRAAVTKALGQLHAMLNPQQRKHLSYMIRSGMLSL